MVLLSACGAGAGAVPTYTPQPTYPPQPTLTPQPTFTPLPTQPLPPTATPVPEDANRGDDQADAVPIPQIRTNIRGQITSEANVRSGPGLQFDIIAPAVPGGIPAFAQGRDSFAEWVLIATPTGIIGWVNTERLSFTQELTTIPVLNSTELPTPQAPAEALTPLANRPEPQVGATQPPAQTESPGAESATPETSGEDIPAGSNLLTNGGFEEPYFRVTTLEGGGAVAEGWEPWWFNDAGDDYSVPEYEVAPEFRDAFRVYSGEAAQQIFRPATLWLAGVYQTVDAPPGEAVRFTIQGHAWSTFCIRQNDEDICDPRDSNYGDSGNPMYMKVGIDPTGGTDGLAEEIIWSDEKIAWDNYVEFSVEAVAESSTITVFTWSTPEFPGTVNNVYWDAASLVVVASR